MLSQMVKVIPVSRTILGRSQFMRLPSVRNYWRRNMFSELSSAMQSVENRMREMDKEMNRLFDDIQRSSPVKLPRIFSPIDWAHTREIPVISKDGDGRVYKVELDMQGMEPEDIKVSLKDQELTVSAQKEEKRPDGSRYVRENKYHYTLPKEVNPETIRSSLVEGVLTIEAPLPALESKEIPVTIESSNSESDSDTKKSN